MRKFLLLTFFSVVAVFLLGGNLSSSDAGGQQFMAVCANGDGTLSTWVNSREEAYLIANDHQKQFSGHNVEILTQGTPLISVGEQACFSIHPTRREGIVRIENQCDVCRSFSIERKTETTEIEEIKMSFEAGKRRFFRTNGGEVTVTKEEACGN